MDKEIALGMRRLSIIDLSPLGHQPMGNEDGTIQIVFNGEIYNYRELGEKLRAKGHRFNSRSDTEVIIHAYEEWGEACLEELRGMFSFAIWDKKERKLFAARDRLGIKPFYYSMKNGSFVFASEIKALLASRLIERELDPEAVYHYLTFGAIPAPRTILKDIRALLPGHKMVLKGEKLDIKRYWDIEISEPNPKRSEQEWAEGLRKLLEESMSLHMISDVPVGAFLSGGIDSSIVVGLMSQSMSRALKTYSIGYDVGGEDHNETDYARIVAERFETDHTEITITDKDIVDSLDDIVWYMDQPSHDGLNSYFISKAAIEGVKVALSGLGGDELFAGYSIFKFSRKLANYQWLTRRIPWGVRQTVEKLNTGLPPRFKNKWLWRGILGVVGCYPTVADQYELVKLFFDSREKEILLPIEFKAGSGNWDHDSSSELLRSLWSEIADRDIVNQVSYLESKTYLCDTLLRDMDAMSMAHSLEVRVPFIDHRLVEYAASIPPELKLNKMVTKYILKESVKDMLPENILSRKKMGFAFPLNLWMRNERLRQVVDDCLSERSIEKREIFRYEPVRRAYNDFYGHDNCRDGQTYMKVWLLVVLELWCRKYLHA
jgi:asparagine synthase (glutamine-hydrolysing)